MSIPTFPNLFIINNGKIYEWSIKIEQNIPNIFTIITCHGQQNGKKIIHSNDIEQGKAKRTPLEQAILEATRKWKNKTEKELYTENIDQLGEKNNSNIVVRPMLANTFSFDLYTKKGKSFKISFPAFIQRKYDGLRCLAYLKNDNVILESRKGIPFQNFSLLKSELKPILKNLPKNFYFDGELYTNEFEFEAISGLSRQHEDKSSKEDIEKINKIEYHIYDFVDLNNINLVYRERLDFLINLQKHKKFNLCKFVDTLLVDNVEDVKKYHDTFVEQGYEGLILRDQNGPYEINKRSKFLQKYKEFIEDEFVIVGFHDNEKEKGMVTWEIINKFGVTENIVPNGTDEYRKELFINASQYIGKLLTVKYFGYTNDKKLKHARGKDIRDIY
jgi:ATP-dependent DNA ligase